MASLKAAMTDADHGQGDPNAPVTLVEYGDYECPACGLAYPVVKKVQSHFGRRLRLIFRNFPLTQIHAQAESAAETAEFAASHGRFWQMHDGLYENQGELGGELYAELAEALRLPVDALAAALEQRTYRQKVRADFMGGVSSGVNGTPTFFINGLRHDAGFDFKTLVGAIEAQLSPAGVHR